MMTFKKSQSLALKVLDTKRDNRRTHYICDIGDGETCDIALFPFQEKEPVPAEVEVYVRDIKDSRPVLSQNTAALFRRFYREGEVYTFQVEEFIPSFPKPYYRVSDRNGIHVKLAKYGEHTDLKPRQYVSCRIVGIGNTTVDLEIVEETKEKKVLEFRPLTVLGGKTKGWLELVNDVLPEEEKISEEEKIFARWALRYSDGSYIPLVPVKEACERREGEWIISLIETMDLHIGEWMRNLLEMNMQELKYIKSNFYVDLLKVYRKLCVYLLEDSDEISGIEDADIRTGYQDLLVSAERNAADYDAAIQLLVRDKEDSPLKYADSVLHKIEKSGYLLHPEKRIKTLRCLFYLKPEIMDEVFPKFMWSIIGSKDVWMREPFHSLLFGLLECYIDYNAGIIDTVGYDDDDIENNRLNLIIRALALELLFAGPDDDVDRLYYRALLYRFASYVPGAESEILLDKAFRCISELDYPALEFGWTIIPVLNPVTLAGLLAKDTGEKANGYKVFHGRDAQLVIEDGAVTLSTYESELRQRKQLPVDMMNWHSVQIMASGKPDVSIKPTAREEDLNKFLVWWTYMDKCVFLSKSEAPQAKPKKVEDEEKLLDEDEILDKRSIVEIARIMERYAVLRDNLKDTYNYLSFASMLVKMVDERSLQDNFDARRRLLVSLYRFSTSESTSVESTIREFEDIQLLVNTDRYTKKLIQQVSIVTCIGNSAQNPSLWSILQESVDEDVLVLAQLVLAYNMLEGVELKNGQREELIEKVNARLGIRISVPKTVIVGYEGQNLEFKTSIVYPPSKTGRVRVALESQTLEILRELCGFMNAEGGTLMLGVNDYGRISGLEQDLLYKDFEGSRDRYCRYIRDSIRTEMGELAESLVTETMLELAGHFVLALRARPSEQPIYLRDNLWQRSGAETLNRVGEVRTSFLRNRSMVYGQLENAKKFSTDWKLDVPLDSESRNGSENVFAPDVQVNEKREEKSKDLAKTFEQIRKSQRREYLINTSCIREKKLSAGDIYPAYYLYLTDGEYYRTEADYDVSNEKVMLSLPVLSEDLEEESWLILLYEDATVLRVPVSEISGRDEWRTYKRFNGQKLFFAGIGGRNDCLVTVFQGSTTPQYRCDDVVRFEEGGMQDVGQPLVTCRYKSILYCEIVPRLAISGMRDGLYNPVKNSLGITIQAAGGIPERKILARAGIKTDF